MAKATTKTFEAVIWEKAEHWTFISTVKAIDEADAYKRLAKEFPKRSYTVRSVQAFC